MRTQICHCELAVSKWKSLPFLAPAVSSLDPRTFSHHVQSLQYESSLYQDKYSLASSANGDRLDAEQNVPRHHPWLGLSGLILSIFVPTSSINSSININTITAHNWKIDSEISVHRHSSSSFIHSSSTPFWIDNHILNPRLPSHTPSKIFQ